MNAATRTVLLNLVQRESRSLLLYVSESFPWITPEEQQALAEIMKIVKAEEHAVGRVARMLQKHHVPIPPLGTYPIGFTTINFTSLDYLVPLLIAYEKQRIEEIELQLASVSDPEARPLVQSILDLKKRHIQILEGIRGKAPVGA